MFIDQSIAGSTCSPKRVAANRISLSNAEPSRNGARPEL